MDISKRKYDNNPFKDSELEITYENVEWMMRLNITALKMYLYIRGHSYRESGVVYFDKEASKVYCEFKQDKSVYNALYELIELGILARTRESFEFYFNPKFMDKEKEC